MKILASDFDGTLYVDNTISEENMEAIKKFQDAGNWFGLCTGRVLMGVERCAKDIDFDFYILNTGSVVLDKKKEDITRHGFPVEIADEIGEMAYKKADIMLFYENNAYSYKVFNNKRGKGELTFTVLTSFKETGAKQLESLSIIFDTEKEAEEFAAIINEKYPGICSAHQNVDAVDVVAPNCSKATGIDDIQKYYNLDRNDIYVIGDSYNDIVMFEAVENSFSFPYAPKNVQDKAKYIVKDIAEAIDMMLSK
ncbi:MAG: HAD-IIB family hydrolase [Coprobacillaceae bacterium]